MHSRIDRSHSLDLLDCGEPDRCAVAVESCLNPVRFDRDDIPPIEWARTPP